MRRTLYLKFLLAYVIFGCFAFIVVATFSSNLTTEHIKRETAETLYREASQISRLYATKLYNNQITLESVTDQLNALAAYVSCSVWLVNPSGTVVVASDEAIDVNNPRIINGFDPSITSDSYYTVGHFFDEFDEDMLSVFTPITLDYKIRGYVVIHKPMRDIYASSNSILNITSVTMVLLVLLSLIILIFFTEAFYFPLRKIITATEQFAAGNMEYEIAIESNDELGYLAASLNYLANEVARYEDNQKKLVANVSHDFRSPLTSIKGYLEAMLDGTIPPEMSQKYLRIVLNETERLTKLTNSLLTLNNLSSKGMILEKTIFDMNLVIRNTAATFEGICQSKQIKINMILTGETMYVKADMSRIQQVLYNLLDNALKFSHNQSVITIETRVKNNKLFVSVKDQGIGIPKDSLKLIFDRFYKTDLSRGKDKKGTGLGLSITKEIIAAHGEHINVISTEGVGSEFIFTLPKVDMDDEL
ncbi:MAG: HAMP domain-containing protein [Lachnospiraceae bacterium]|nr:HAMP domain-containing protein [Lachnospiraceae bacterium]